jgi:F-type H+-transporting ATPase subunit a
MFNILAEGSPLEHVVDHAIWQTSGGFWLFSNHIVMLLLAGLIMLIVFPLITRGYRDGEHVPTGTRNFIEAIMMYVRNDVAKPLLGDDTDRFMPFLWTLFFYILTCNILGLLPLNAIQDLILGRGNEDFHAVYGTATSNFFVTAVLAGIVFCVVQFNGIATNGFDGWLKHFLGGAPWWLFPIMVPVEILGMIIKPFALAVRLAANMTAGHILLATLGGFVPLAFLNLGRGGGLAIGTVSVIASVVIMMLELFVALLQAYLFVFLTSLFLSQMITHHHDEAHHHEEEEVGELGEPVAVREGQDDHLTPKFKPAH